MDPKLIGFTYYSTRGINRVNFLWIDFQAIAYEKKYEGIMILHLPTDRVRNFSTNLRRRKN